MNKQLRHSSITAVKVVKSRERTFDKIGGLYGNVVAVAMISDDVFGASICCPWTNIPADKIGDVIRVLQQAAEWAFDQEKALRR